MRTLFVAGRLLAGCLSAVIVLAGCTSSGSGGASSPPAGTGGASSATRTVTSFGQSGGEPAAAAADITIKNFGYSGQLTVKPGEKVTVVNRDATAHTLTDKKTKKFDTGTIKANGGTGTFTAPSRPGRYPFGCTIHPEMAGTLIVQK